MSRDCISKIIIILVDGILIRVPVMVYNNLRLTCVLLVMQYKFYFKRNKTMLIYTVYYFAHYLFYVKQRVI